MSSYNLFIPLNNLLLNIKDKMEEAGRIVEEILKYLREEGSVEREDIKETFGLEEEKIAEIQEFLLDLKLIEMGCQRLKITKLGLEFLQL